MSTLPTSERISVAWLREGRRVVNAMLVERIGSAPLDPGAQMLVDDRGNIEGSVTGGCVEGALVEEAGKILAGEAPRVVTYGISDEEAGDVGLMCGGTVRIFVHEQGAGALEALEAVAVARDAGEPVALATLLDGASAATKMAILDDRRRRRSRRHRPARCAPWRATRGDSSTRGSRACAATAPAAR